MGFRHQVAVMADATAVPSDLAVGNPLSTQIALVARCVLAKRFGTVFVEMLSALTL